MNNLDERICWRICEYRRFCSLARTTHIFYAWCISGKYSIIAYKIGWIWKEGVEGRAKEDEWMKTDGWSRTEKKTKSKKTKRKRRKEKYEKKKTNMRVECKLRRPFWIVKCVQFDRWYIKFQEFCDRNFDYPLPSMCFFLVTHSIYVCYFNLLSFELLTSPHLIFLSLGFSYNSISYFCIECHLFPRLLCISTYFFTSLTQLKFLHLITYICIHIHIVNKSKQTV